MVKNKYPNFKITTKTSVQEGYKFLESEENHFQLIYVIVSGNLSEIYLDFYKSTKKNINLVTANIIFCSNDTRYNNRKLYSKFSKHSFFPGGIVSNFNEVIKYIEKDETGWGLLKSGKTKFPLVEKKQKDEGYGEIFHKVQSLEEIAYPLIFQNLIYDSKLYEDKLQKFTELIYEYSSENPEIIDLISPTHEKIIQIEDYVYAKYFIRIYSLQTKFYSDMNRNLANNYLKEYKVFIFILYNALRNGIIKNYVNKELYRGTIMSKTQFEELKKDFDDAGSSRGEISFVSYFTKNFQSYSKKDEVANSFLDENKNKVKKDEILVKFVIKPLEKKYQEFFVSNLEVEGFCKNGKEEEEV